MKQFLSNLGLYALLGGSFLFVFALFFVGLFGEVIEAFQFVTRL